MSTTLTKPKIKRDSKPFVKPRTGVESPKGLAKSLVNRLPDDATWEQIQYHIDVLTEIAKGEEDIENGRFVSLEEIEREFLGGSFRGGR